MSIDEKNFPIVIDIMQKFMFQEAAETLEEAIRVFPVGNPELIPIARSELDSILTTDFSESEYTDFVSRHSDYLVSGSGKMTLELMREIISDYSTSDE